MMAWFSSLLVFLFPDTATWFFMYLRLFSGIAWNFVVDALHQMSREMSWLVDKLCFLSSANEHFVCSAVGYRRAVMPGACLCILGM